MTDTQHDWRNRFRKECEWVGIIASNFAAEYGGDAEAEEKKDMKRLEDFIQSLLHQRDEELVAKIHERLRLPVDDVGELEDELIALVRERGI